MPTLDETPDAKRAALQTLSSQYRGRVEDGQVVDLVRRLGGQEAQKVLGAIDAHITDGSVPQGRSEPVGHFPPSLAQLMARIKGEGVERTVTPSESRVAYRKGRRVVIELSEEAQKWTGLGPRIETWASPCRHCGGGGMARYYADPQKPKRVWSAEEALELPTEMYLRLRCQSAICVCEDGHTRKEAELTTVMWWRSQEVTVPVFVRLERILDAARQRRQEEKEVLA